ncbi:MAG: 4-hydroxy-tetrahydrodipicolinate reductase [Saprospiraceae bacterium]|nr:4-hydroxy-tetrahydrodipicolinate reductase [Saprospiraceae bacterium]
MKIAILGYGKMGKIIDELATAQGHQIVLKISSANQNLLTAQHLQHVQADVAIEFSRPESAFDNITTCFMAGIPVVSGTTAWLDRYEEACEICKEQKGAFLYASNFSLGVNIFFSVNQKLAALMQPHTDYSAKMLEIHHTEKLDAPSGTAITLAEGIIAENPKLNQWNLGTEASEESSIPIEAQRIAKVPGTHIVTYSSEVDQIIIKHEAKSRKGFALGAITAAKWLIGKEGIYSMQDLINGL